MSWMYLYFNQYQTVAESVIIFYILNTIYMKSLMSQTVKHLPAMQETWVQSLGQEDLLEKEMATHSSILAWTIPWMEELGSLQSIGSQRVKRDWATSLHTEIYEWIYQWIYIYIYICMYVYVYIYIFIVIENSSFIFLLLHTLIKYPYFWKWISPGVICAGVVLMKCQIYIWTFW